MKYKINCKYCGDEISVEANEDMDAMMKMKEAAKRHNSAKHPEAKEIPDLQLEEDIKKKWSKE